MIIKNDVKVSIIIPTYNRAKLIKKSVNSVLKQTYKNIEVIVVDDCSSDNTEEVIKSINDDRVKYVKLPKNSGASYARNVGIKKSTGEYITFQDSDDIFYKDKIEKQLKNLLKNKSDMDFCKIAINDADNKLIIPDNLEDKRLEKMTIFDRLCEGNIISTQAIFIKKSILDKIKFDDTLPRYQDYDLVLRIASKYKISYTKEVLVDLYRQKNSISNSSERLRKSCLIMLNKKYDMNEKQKEVFINNLLSVNNMDKIIELNGRIQQLENHQKELDDLVNELNKVIMSKDEIINNMLNSKSWKMTKPIRKFSSIMHKNK